jgi:PIN domain nuclease of toxin-antitoxin system
VESTEVILLDTHALIWLDTADRRLGRKTRALIERQWAENKVAVSAISFWEAGMLTQRGRFQPAVPIAEWRIRWLQPIVSSPPRPWRGRPIL